MQASLASCSYTPAFAHVGRAQNPARQPAGRPAAARQQNVARQRRSLRCVRCVGGVCLAAASPCNRASCCSLPFPSLPCQAHNSPPCACRVASADSDLTQEELEEQLEAFMRRQAAIEGGEAARKVEPGKVLGASEVSEEVRGGAGRSGICRCATAAGVKSGWGTQKGAVGRRTPLPAGRPSHHTRPVRCCALGVQEAKRYCREVVTVLKRLKEQRDMTLNEVRLTVAIEDPRARERRLMGMEVGGAVPGWRADDWLGA